MVPVGPISYTMKYHVRHVSGMYIYIVTNEEIIFNARRVGEDEATQSLPSPLRNSKKKQYQRVYMFSSGHTAAHLHAYCGTVHLYCIQKVVDKIELKKLEKNKSNITIAILSPLFRPRLSNTKGRVVYYSFIHRGQILTKVLHGIFLLFRISRS